MFPSHYRKYKVRIFLRCSHPFSIQTDVGDRSPHLAWTPFIWPTCILYDIHTRLSCGKRDRCIHPAPLPYAEAGARISTARCCFPNIGGDFLQNAHVLGFCCCRDLCVCMRSYQQPSQHHPCTVPLLHCEPPLPFASPLAWVLFCFLMVNTAGTLVFNKRFSSSASMGNHSKAAL